MSDPWGPRGPGPDPNLSDPPLHGASEAAYRQASAGPTGWERRTLERLAFAAALVYMFVVRSPIQDSEASVATVPAI